MHVPQGSQRPMFGAILMLISIMMFAVMDGLVKWLSADYPIYQIMFFRSAVALVPVTIFITMAGGVSILKTNQIGLHFVRCSLGVCAMWSAFTGISMMPLADAMAIFHSAPILMTALSVPILKERVGPRRWSAVFIGFLGVLLVVKPGTGVFGSGALFMVFAAFVVALGSNIIRVLSRLDDPACITFYFTFTSTVVSAMVSLIWGWTNPSTIDLLLLMAIGILGGCAQYFMTVSFKNAEVGLVSPLKYLTIVIAGVIGYVFWQEIPDQFSQIGIVIIISAGVYTMHREARINGAKKESADITPLPVVDR